jgi:hypothetical protein
MRTSLFSPLYGGNSTIIAMAKWPDEFEHIIALSLHIGEWEEGRAQAEITPRLSAPPFEKVGGDRLISTA